MSLIKSIQQKIPIRNTSILLKKLMSTHPGYEFDTLKVTSPDKKVLHVEMNRPEKRNAMNKQFFSDMTNCFNQVNRDGSIRAVVLSGSGKLFSSGLDLMDFASNLMSADDNIDPSRRALEMRAMILELQNAFTVIAKCRQPVIAAVHSGCVGGGIDMICSCDIRLCTEDAWLQIKEVDIGIAADIGTLQRLPKLIGSASLIRELAFTARKFDAAEALQCGLMSKVYETKEKMMEGAISMATLIASKSPVAMYGTKLNLNFAQDHTVDENLDYIATWNQSMLQTEDLLKATQATMMKETAEFNDLPSSKL